MIIYADGFRQYIDGTDLLSEWLTVPATWLINPGAGPNGTTSINRQGGSYGGGTSIAITRDLLDAASVVGFSVDIKTDNYTPVFAIGLSPAGYHARAELSPVVAVILECVNGSFNLVHRIPTGETGNSNNGMLLASLPAIAPNTTYHVEMLVDHSQPEATAQVWLNGALVADVTYTRDRLDNGYQATDFREFSFTSGALTTRSRSSLSNVYVYSPDSEDVSPVGMFDISGPLTENTAVTLAPVNDGTEVVVANEAWTDIPVADVTAGQEIVAAFVHYRLAAKDGQDPALAEVAVEVAGQQLGYSSYHAIPPGLGAVTITRQLPESSLTDVVLKFRSGGE